MARPSKWDELDMPSKLDAITGWAKQGSTNEDIAKMLGISCKLLYEWQNKYSEFREAIKKGKDVSNGELLNSAFTQSTGFYYTEQVPIKVRINEAVPTADGKSVKYLPAERIELVEVRKYQPPNPTMSIFMLKNRLPGDYKDKREIEATGKDGGPIQTESKSDLSRLSVEELRQLAELSRKAAGPG